MRWSNLGPWAKTAIGRTHFSQHLGASSTSRSMVMSPSDVSSSTDMMSVARGWLSQRQLGVVGALCAALRRPDCFSEPSSACYLCTSTCCFSPLSNRRHCPDRYCWATLSGSLRRPDLMDGARQHVMARDIHAGTRARGPAQRRPLRAARCIFVPRTRTPSALGKPNSGSIQHHHLAAEPAGRFGRLCSSRASFLQQPCLLHAAVLHVCCCLRSMSTVCSTSASRLL